jgi:hypothetical protein
MRPARPQQPNRQPAPEKEGTSMARYMQIRLEKRNVACVARLRKA